MADTQEQKELKQIYSVLRHKLGNSVNSLKITLEVLQEGYDSFDEKKKKEYLQRASSLVCRQQEMVAAMKSYAQSDVRSNNVVSIPPFWNRFTDAISDRLRGSNIDLCVTSARGSPAILGDQTALGTAMVNVLDNAVESLGSARKPRIELAVSESKEEFDIVLRDNGCGISQSHLPKIFIPFFTTKPGRMGMGLSITRKILLEMGGHINIESRVGYGTEALLRLRKVNA
jgi:C4-dicarboxylate-specific signal transduction histidine kinase